MNLRFVLTREKRASGFCAAIVTACLGAGTLSAFGQTTMGTFVGHITDTTGAAIANAQIILTEEGTGASANSVTNASGDYTFASVRPGAYAISVTSTGFSKVAFRHLNLDIGQVLRQDATLRPGSTETTVDVTADIPIVQTDSSSVGSVVDGRQIEDTPLNGRSNIFQLMGISPGVQRPNSNALVSGSSFNAGLMQTVDGIALLDIFNGRMASQPPTLEDIAEFTVIDVNAPAEFGHGGGQVIIQTKGGTNQFHGSAFAFNRNRYFQARPYFLPQNQRLAPFNRNELGGSIGGPIIRNRLFFFFAVEDLRRVTSTVVTQPEPPTPFLNGDFSTFTSTATVFDPQTGQAFPNNQIPAYRISPVSAQFLKYYSAPNIAGGLGNNFTFNDPTYELDPRWSVRGDYQASNADHIMVRYFRNHDGPYLSALGGTDKFGNYAGLGTLIDNYAASWTRAFSPHVMNEAIGGFNKEQDPRLDQNHNVDPSSLIPGIPSPPAGHGGLPTINIQGLVSIGGPGSNFDNHQHIVQLNDNLSVQHGNHNMKFGGQYIEQTASQGGVTLGSFSFDGRYSGHYKSNGFTNGQSPNPVDAFADFLLGYMFTDSTANAENHYNTNGKAYALYAEDSWQASPRLTLNFGARYDKTLPFGRTLGGVANFYPDTGLLVVIQGSPDPNLAAKYPILSGSSVGITPSNYIHTQNLNFAPRLGFAYRPWGGRNFVVRGGFGIMYDYFTSLINGLAGQPPFNSSVTFNAISGASPSLSLANPFPTANGSLPANPNLSAVPRSLQTPYQEQFNLTVEDEFMRNTAFRISYIGNLGRHLPIPLNINDPQPVVVPAGKSLQSFRRFQPWGNISLQEYSTNSNLNEAQVSVRRRFADLSLDLEYQWLKALGIDGFNDGGATNTHDISYDYGNLDFYSHHYLALNYSYNLPLGTGKKLVGNAGPLLNRLIGGWRFSGVWTAFSGQPFFVSFTSTVTGWPSNRATRLYNVPAYPARKTPAEWFNPSAFVVPSPYTFGLQQRNDLFGPGFSDWDTAVSKTMKLSERINFEFRAECFNTLNRANFAVPARNISVPSTVGKITATTNDPRELQFGARLTF